MKECIAWKSDDGKMRSFVEQHVVDYENKWLRSAIDDGLLHYIVKDCEDLVGFLRENEETIRSIMGWEQITF
jgi:hypothetical protein